MKRIFYVLFFCTALIGGNACNGDEEPKPKPRSNSINKILTLGASRVEGYRPHYESYRYELWKDLKEGGWVFDFIGTRSDPASYPSFNNQAFDPDHEGRGGYSSGEILRGLEGWLSATGSPDIVLFSSPAGNDILNGQNYAQSIANVKAIVDLLQLDNENVIIIIERPAPGRSDFMTAQFSAAFNQLQQDVLSIAANKSTTTSPVIALDMYTGFNDSHLADDVHYNQAGADFIASRYYRELSNWLTAQ